MQTQSNPKTQTQQSNVVFTRTKATKSRTKESPNWVRISAASAIALGFKSGRFTQEFEFGGINLLLNYDDGCKSDCAYCGLARTRPGDYEDKSFIRVEWPLVETDTLVERMRLLEAKLTRLCISMVTNPYAFRDTCTITDIIVRNVRTPLSILVAPPTLNRAKLEEFKTRGVDMIGIGLDAVTETLFRSLRTDVPAGGSGLSWTQYWKIVSEARTIFGPWKVNCHTVVGLGETDFDLIDMFDRLVSQEIFPYLFCFNPEPDSRMGSTPKSTITRWRRIQLAKYLVEQRSYKVKDFEFSNDGSLTGIKTPSATELVAAANDGIAFMTNGCPGPNGEPGCTRPYGSYKPSESYRDYPFLPSTTDLQRITSELELDGLTL